MITRVTILLVSFCVYLSQVAAQEEVYYFDAGSGRRAGMASLRVIPDLEKQRSDIIFTTTQSGVSHTNKFRIALQWIRNIQDNAQAEWEAIVFELRVPQGGGDESPAINKILTGRNYYRYVRDAGIWTNDEFVDLVLVDQDNQVTTDTTNNYRGSDDDIHFKVIQSNVVVGTDTTVDLKISAPYLDPVGQNLLWYKWTFYNDAEECDTVRFENYCFATAPIDGQKIGYLYTTYIGWHDFYLYDEVMTFYWVHAALSPFWILGQIGMAWTALFLQIYLTIKSIIGSTNASQHTNVEQYQGEITTLIVGTHIFTVCASILMILVTGIPVAGPIFNITGLILVGTYVDNIDSLIASFGF